MQDLLAFNCLTWLFVNENPVVNYSTENIIVSQLWMADILVNSCKDCYSWFQLGSYMITIVFLYMMNSNLMIKKNPIVWSLVKYSCQLQNKCRPSKTCSHLFMLLESVCTNLSWTRSYPSLWRGAVFPSILSNFGDKYKVIISVIAQQWNGQTF